MVLTLSGHASPNSRRLQDHAAFLILMAVLGLTFLVYYSGLTGPFVLDDAASLLPLTADSLQWAAIKEVIFRGGFGGFSRSVTNLSFVLTEYTSGFNAQAYKYQNLMLHIANGLLVFWFVALLFQVRNGAQRTSHFALWPALLAASLWVLHPLQISTVLYAVQRLVILSAFFSLLAMICYLKGRLLLASRPTQGVAIIFLGMLAFWPLGVLSKQNAVLVAPALLVIEAVLFRSPTRAGPRTEWARLIVAGFLLLPIALGFVYLLLRQDVLLGGYIGRDYNLFERILTEVHALWFYLKLILFPVPAEMSLFHDDFPIQRTLDLRTAIAAAGLLLLLLGAIASNQRWPLVAIGILWFFVWHALESSILPLELVFEHRNYLALLGPMLLVTLFVSSLWRWIKLRRVAILTAAALVLLLAFNTASRAAVWSNVELLVLSQYERNRESPRIVEWMYLISSTRGDAVAAERHARELEKLVPDQAWPFSYRFMLECSKGRPSAALLDRMLVNARSGLLRPADTSSLVRIQTLLERQGCGDLGLDFALDLAEALANNPRAHTPHTRLYALDTWGRLAAKLGRFETAKGALRRSLELSGQQSGHWVNRSLQTIGDAAAQTGSYAAAMTFIQEVTAGYESIVDSKDIALRLSFGDTSGD